MDMKNSDIKKNINKLKDVKATTDTQIAKQSGGLLAPSSMSKFMSRPEESNPTVKTLRGISHATKIEPWMLLVPDFPFEVINHHPLKTISPEGYVLLQAFEKATPETRENIIKQLAYFMSEYEHNPHQSKRLRDVSAHYNVIEKDQGIDV